MASSTSTAPSATGISGPETAATRGGLVRHAWRQLATFAVIGICVIALLWAIVFTAIRRDREAALEHARVEANNLSAAFAAEVAGKLDATVRILDFLAFRLRSDPSFNLIAWAQEHRRLASPVLMSAWIVGADGTLGINTRGAMLARGDLSERDYFRFHRDHATSSPYIGRLSTGTVSGQTGIPVSRRLEDSEGRFRGVLTFKLAPDRLTVLHRSANIGRGGILTLIGDDDILRARFTAGSLEGDATADRKVPARPISATDGRPEETFIRTSTTDGIVRLYSARQVEPYPLRVSVGFDMAEVMASPTRHAWQIQAAAAAATLILIGLMSLLVREILRRADREAKLAAQIAHGSEVLSRLGASEARLRDFAEMASDWFWEQDETLRFTQIGTAAPPQVPGGQWHIGRFRWDLANGLEDPSRWDAHKQDLLAHRPFRDFRYGYRGVDGQPRYVSINGAPVFDEAGVFKGYRGTGRDVTHETEAAENLRRSRDEAAAANRAKSAFLSNMSHELRTPLNAIIGFAELIQSPGSHVTVEQCSIWAGDILSSGLHLLNVLNDIIALSRIEAGRYGLADDRVDLGQAVRTAVAAALRRPDDNRVSIDHGKADIGLVLRADSRAIQQVLLNVVSNAVKFSPDGGVVTIRAEVEGTEVAIVVSDSGIGIAPAALNTIGEPFTQADSTIGRRYSGAGLGLTISRKLVELHGGSLSIDSVVGQGTTVRIVLPAVRIIARRSKAVS